MQIQVAKVVYSNGWSFISINTLHYVVNLNTDVVICHFRHADCKPGGPLVYLSF